MANNLESNFSRDVMEKVIPAFESKRVLSKNVNTQLFEGKFNPKSGTEIDVKRPTDYVTTETSDGNISTTRSDIIVGKATATVQDYITVAVDYDEVDEALKLGDMSDFWGNMTNRIVTKLETNFAAFAMKNLGLNYGDPDQGVNTWAEVAGAGALMQSSGIPMDKRWCYFLNPYSQVALATEQRSLGVNPEAGSANKMATVSENFAGFDVKTATTLPTYTLPTTGDLVGAVTASVPDVTYVTAKDSMTQSIALDGVGTFTGTITAGTTVKITGVNRLNMSTRSAIVDSTGASIVYMGTVTADAAFTSGAGTIVVTGPALYEAAGAYNTVDRAIIENDVVTFMGTDATTFQPNLFWHPDALTIASVPIKKLHSTDTLATTADGLQLRVSKYSDGDANSQTVRFDLHPAFGVMNPFMGGHGYGTA